MLLSFQMPKVHMGLYRIEETSRSLNTLHTHAQIYTCLIWICAVWYCIWSMLTSYKTKSIQFNTDIPASPALTAIDTTACDVAYSNRELHCWEISFWSKMLGTAGETDRREMFLWSKPAGSILSDITTSAQPQPPAFLYDACVDMNQCPFFFPGRLCVSMLSYDCVCYSNGCQLVAWQAL